MCTATTQHAGNRQTTRRTLSPGGTNFSSSGRRYAAGVTDKEGREWTTHGRRGKTHTRGIHGRHVRRNENWLRFSLFALSIRRAPEAAASSLSFPGEIILLFVRIFLLPASSIRLSFHSRNRGSVAAIYSYGSVSMGANVFIWDSALWFLFPSLYLSFRRRFHFFHVLLSFFLGCTNL